MAATSFPIAFTRGHLRPWRPEDAPAFAQHADCKYGGARGGSNNRRTASAAALLHQSPLHAPSLPAAASERCGPVAATAGRTRSLRQPRTRGSRAACRRHRRARRRCSWRSCTTQPASSAASGCLGARTFSALLWSWVSGARGAACVACIVARACVRGGFLSLLLPLSHACINTHRLGRAFWGAGIGSAAVAAFLPYAWHAAPDAARIEALVYAFNERSCRLLERLGFTREGRLARAAFKDGRFCDSIVFGLLRPDGADGAAEVATDPAGT